MIEPKDLIKLAEECCSKCATERCLLDIVNRIKAVFESAFDNENGYESLMTEEELNQAFKSLEYSRVALLILRNGKIKFSELELYKLYEISISAMCGFQDFDVLLHLDKFLDIVANCFKDSGKELYSEYINLNLEFLQSLYHDILIQSGSYKTKLFSILNSKTISKLFSDEHRGLKELVATNIISSLLSSAKPREDINLIITLLDFSLNLIERIQVVEIKEKLATILISHEKRKKSQTSSHQHMLYLDQILKSIHSINFEDIKSAYLLFKYLGDFVQDNCDLLARSEHKNIILNWVNMSLKFLSINPISEIENLCLPIFSSWMVLLEAIDESNSDCGRKYFMNKGIQSICGIEIMEMCKKRIDILLSVEKQWDHAHLSPLAPYIDIFTCVLSLSSIAAADFHYWFEKKISNIKSYHNHTWFKYMRVLLKTELKLNRDFFKKFLPPIEYLWNAFKTKELSLVDIINWSILSITSYDDGSDELRKQLTPLLIIPLIKDLRDKYGSKWDNIRIHLTGAARISMKNSCTLMDLEKYIPVNPLPDYLKVQMLTLALLFDKKPNAFNQLLPDIFISIVTRIKSKAIKLPINHIVSFIQNNISRGLDIFDFLIDHLSKEIIFYDAETISQFMVSARFCLCFYSGKGKECSCSENNTSESNIRINEPSLKLLIEMFIKNCSKFTSEVIQDFFELCCSIVVHVDSSNIFELFQPLLLLIDVVHKDNSKIFIKFWNYLESKNTLSEEDTAKIYHPICFRLISKVNVIELKQIFQQLMDPNISTIVSVAALSSLCAHSAISDNSGTWCALKMFLPLCCRNTFDDNKNCSNKMIYRQFYDKYIHILANGLLYRLTREEEASNETSLRNYLKTYISALHVFFKISTIKEVVESFRASLLFEAISAGLDKRHTSLAVSIIDFIAQEMDSSTFSLSQTKMTHFGEFEFIKSKRKTMITELFPSIVQSWRIDKRSDKELWEFCKEQCDFNRDDLGSAISVYRKEIIERLIFISANDIVNPNSNCVIGMLQKTYESLHRGRTFSLASVMEYRGEGVDILFEFRRNFALPITKYLRDSGEISFCILLEKISKQFLDENWWIIAIILSAFRRDGLRAIQGWSIFVERLEFEILRVNLWKIVSFIANVEHRDDIIKKLWKRMAYSRNADVLERDPMMQRLLWSVRHSVDEELTPKVNAIKCRRLTDAIQMVKEFDNNPAVFVSQHVEFMIEKEMIWKTDLSKTISELVSILSKCSRKHQREDIARVLRRVPIQNSEEADSDFQSWDKQSDMFTKTPQRTQELLWDCVAAAERNPSCSRMSHLDRTLSEVFKYFDVNDSTDFCKNSVVQCVKQVYKRIYCFNKPDPDLEKFNDGGADVLSFEEWMTKLILLCVQEDEDTQFQSFLYIAHIPDTTFLVKLLTMVLVYSIQRGRQDVVDKIMLEFEQALHIAAQCRVTWNQRMPACYVFYIFDFIYYYMNSELMMNSKELRKQMQLFWKSIMELTTKDDYGHQVPLIVSVAERFGMEKRCILWLELNMELKSSVEWDKQSQLVYYFMLMRLHARCHELTGVMGAYSRLSNVNVDHVYAKILLKEAYGNTKEAETLYKVTEQKVPFKPIDIVEKSLKEVEQMYEKMELTMIENEEFEMHVNDLKMLGKWMKCDEDFGPSPQFFESSMESRAFETRLIVEMEKSNLTIIQDGIEKNIQKIRETSLTGTCSYESAIPALIQIQMIDEVERIYLSSDEQLLDGDSDLWKFLRKRTEEGQQRLDVLEPVLRARINVLTNKMKRFGDRDKDRLRSRIVESYLHCARVARLHGCRERAQLMILNAKKVHSFDKRIVLEEAKLQLQYSNDQTGMTLLDSLLATTFGELTKHFSDTQQTTNLDLKQTAMLEIQNFPKDEKDLYSEVQMLRISHTIKSGNTIEFDKIYEETTKLLASFVSSGVMYEAAWLLDYLFHYNEKNRTVLPLLKAYRDVAKYERNSVLQARAIERMTSLWLTNTRKLRPLINSTKNIEFMEQMNDQMKVMNSEMESALKEIGWRAFYPAYAILTRQIDHIDIDVFSSIKKMMIQLIIRLPHQCMWQSVYLLRSQDCEKIKKYNEVLTHLKRKHPTYVTLIEQYDYASAAFKTVAERVRQKDAVLSEVVPQMKKLIRDKKYEPKHLEVGRRVEDEKELVCGIILPIRSDIDSSVATVPEVGYENAFEIDDRFVIHDFSEKIKILASNTKPVLIELLTLSGRKVRLICKKDDDLSKDYHFTKIVGMCNDLLAKDDQTRIRALNATTYSVIPLAKTGGIIEFIDGVTPYYEALDKLLNLKAEKVTKWAAGMRSLPKDRRADYFRDVCCKNTPLVMAKWFRQTYTEAGKWFASRKLFAKSTSVMSIIGYIFGLGDRHTRNLMIHLPTGKCVHVDFDMIFNMGDFLEIPEVVPFRLTRNMINGMGEVALDGEFRFTCEQVIRVFRENSYEIEKYIADLPDLVTGHPALHKTNAENSRYKYDMTEAKRMVSARLRGHIVTAKVYKSKPISHPMKCAQLASSLIELATSDEKLSEMYHGWMPSV